MGWMSYADRRGQGWELDLDQVSRIIYAACFSEKKRTRARLVTESRGGDPDLYRVTISFRGLSQAVRAEAQRRYARFRQLLARDGEAAFEMLLEQRCSAISHENHVLAMQRRSLRQTARSLARGEQVAETAIATLRQAPITVLIIGSAFVTGGGSLVALGLGSGLQGLETYRATGSVGVAALHASTTFVCGAIPLGPNLGAAAASGSQRAALFVVGVQLNAGSSTAVSIAMGDEPRHALVSSVTNAGLGGVVSELGGDFFENLAVPLRIPLEVAISSGIDAASGAVADRIAPAQGQASAAFASPGGRPLSRGAERSLVSLFAMRRIRHMARSRELALPGTTVRW